jgi:ABC-type Mn2+/Zn2+ transport system permease subunit
LPPATSWLNILPKKANLCPSDILTLEKIVNRTNILVLRALLGVVFGVVLTRLFYPDASVGFMIGLCAILVGLSYLTEYLRRRKK